MLERVVPYIAFGHYVPRVWVTGLRIGEDTRGISPHALRGVSGVEPSRGR